MTNKRDYTSLLHITRCKGKMCKVELKTGETIIGILAYYNINDQMIHLNAYRQYNKDNMLKPTERGKMMVINAQSWLNLKIIEEDDKNE